MRDKRPQPRLRGNGSGEDIYTRADQSEEAQKTHTRQGSRGSVAEMLRSTVIDKWIPNRRLAYQHGVGGCILSPRGMRIERRVAQEEMSGRAMWAD
jgi:hypothetical protein